MIKMAIILKLR